MKKKSVFLCFLLLLSVPLIDLHALSSEPPQEVLQAVESLVQVSTWGTDEESGVWCSWSAHGVVLGPGMILGPADIFWGEEPTPDVLLKLEGLTVYWEGKKLLDLDDLSQDPILDNEKGLALLLTDKKLPRGLPIAEPSLHQKVWILRYRDLDELAVIPGIISDLGKEIPSLLEALKSVFKLEIKRKGVKEGIFIDVEELPDYGACGSPVVNSHGELVGIVVADNPVLKAVYASPATDAPVPVLTPAH